HARRFLYTAAPPTTDTHAPSLHDALPIWTAAAHARQADRRDDRDWREQCAPAARSGGRHRLRERPARGTAVRLRFEPGDPCAQRDRKSTRLNSSHLGISYAVFCLKKKNNI